MSCLLAGLAALLALAVPASIARSSLVGAYVVIAALAAAAVAGVWTARRRRSLPTGTAPRRSTALVWVGALTVGYALAVTVIHAV